MRKLVYGEDDRVAAWAAQHIEGCVFRPDRVAIGVERAGELVGAVVFDTFSKADAHVHIAAPRWGAVGRDLLIAAAAYAFNQCGLRRVTYLIRFDNDRAKTFVTHMGAKLETVLEEADEAGRPYLQFRMLAREVARNRLFRRLR